MKLEEFANILPQKLKEIPGSENWFIHSKYGTNLMDSVTVIITTIPKEEWPGGIRHNAPGFQLFIDERNRRREIGTGPYKMEVSTIWKMPVKLVGKTGSLEQILASLVKYMTRVSEALAAGPVTESVRLPEILSLNPA